MSAWTVSPEVAEFVAAMTRAYQGREMAERVFCQVAKAHPGHAASVTDEGLAEYLVGQGWSFYDVVRRES